LRLKNFIVVVLGGKVHLHKRAIACEDGYPITLAAGGEMARSAKGAGKRSQLRIIGGQWRGRKLSFIPADGLRPTTDRIRETLFNWLAPCLHDARCADLFAGSGALGLEALSRGAAHCDFVDTSSGTLAQIGRHLTQLGASERAQCHAMPAESFLGTPRPPFDIVFIDPPFDRDLAAPVCNLLAERRLLTANALVYVETGAGEPCPGVPQHWRLHREKSTGGVAYRLFSMDPD
jgi:16S rRNA (guanine966-N2)-methyltransferase